MVSEQRKAAPDNRGALEEAVEQAIAGCDGDLQATIRALVVTNHFLHSQIERLSELTSQGYARGKLSLLDLP